MEIEEALSFGTLLRRYRLAAELTQEELAERADLSARAVSDLERGISTRPYRDTIAMLAMALGLSAAEQAALTMAVQRRRPPKAASPAREHPLQPRRLPLTPTPSIGRDAEIAALEQLLSRHETRLVTLTGPPGVGKTCVGLQVASLVAGTAVEVCFVPLAPIRNPNRVVPAIAQTLGVKPAGETPVMESLIAALSGRRLLLVLDNFEHVLEAASLLADLLAACPQLTLLVTSQAALRLRGEQTFPLAPLAVPPVGSAHAIETVAASPAVALFVQRAQAVDPGFQLTPATAPAVVGICRTLDGLPLAIELAAARGKLFSPQALLTRLSRRLDLLTAGARDLPPRQQSLRAALSWSYDLLHAGEQALVQRLAVFVGGSTLEAVEAVCAPTDTGGYALTKGDLLEWLSGLLDKSLLRREDAPTGEEPRFWMLETIREFGLERLRENGAMGEVRRRHVAYYLALAEAAEPALAGPRQEVWLARLTQELGNLRVALRWSQRHRESELGLRLAGALLRFWDIQGLLGEGREWLEGLLALEEQGGAVTPASTRARALKAAGVLAMHVGDFAQAEARLEESLGLYQALGDMAGRAFALRGLGTLARHRSDYARGAARLEESVALYRGLADKPGLAEALDSLGKVALWAGDLARAATAHEESLILNRDLGNRQGIAGALDALGNVARHEGDYRRAIPLLEESVALHRELGDKPGLARVLNNLASTLRDFGADERAGAHFEESVVLSRELGHTWGIALALRGLGHVARERGDYRRATEYLDESRALFARLGHVRGVAFALTALGAVARAQGDYARATALCEESVRIFREHGDTLRAAEMLISLSDVIRERGDYARAAALLEESLAHLHDVGFQRLAALALHGLGRVARDQGDHERVATCFEQSRAIFAAMGHGQGVATALVNLGLVACEQGDYIRASALCEEGLRFFRRQADTGGCADALLSLGLIAREQGGMEGARARYVEGLALCRDRGPWWTILTGVEGVAAALALQEQPERAVRLWSMVETQRRAHGAPLPPNDRARCDRDVVAARAAIGEAAFALAWTAGAALSQEQAVAEALATACTQPTG